MELFHWFLLIEVLLVHCYLNIQDLDSGSRRNRSRTLCNLFTRHLKLLKAEKITSDWYKVLTSGNVFLLSFSIDHSSMTCFHHIGAAVLPTNTSSASRNSFVVMYSTLSIFPLSQNMGVGFCKRDFFLLQWMRDCTCEEIELDWKYFFL